MNSEDGQAKGRHPFVVPQPRPRRFTRRTAATVSISEWMRSVEQGSETSIRRSLRDIKRPLS